MKSVLKFVGNEKKVINWSIFAILSYYFVSLLFVWGNNHNVSLLSKNSCLDILTSLLWTIWAILLILSLFYVCLINISINLKTLIKFYFLFIFLFAIIYGLLDWHMPNTFFSVEETGTFIAELKYFVISIQTQTTLGYTSSKPLSIVGELMTSLHSLFGIFFISIFISLAVNKFSSEKKV